MKKLIKKLFGKKKKRYFNEEPYDVYVRVIENYKLGPYELKKLEEANYHLSKMKSLP